MCAGPVPIPHSTLIRNLREQLSAAIAEFPDCGERQIARQKASELLYWLDATQDALI